MSHPWRKRKTRLKALLEVGEDEVDQGLVLDRLIHGQNVIGKTTRTVQIDELKFDNKDIDIIGTLDYGQYGVIDVVTCKLDGRNYVRKSIEKRFALRTQDQCSPQTERDVLIRALKSETRWTPHLLCTFQTPTHLNFVMEFAEGGTLWDVLESSSLDMRIEEEDVYWWAPQVVSAIGWCHSQGFVHRDIKPHNFVLKSTSHILLIDFGSAAKLLPPDSGGCQLVPKRYTLVPCGTCDYISPEILQAHEEALVDLEMADTSNASIPEYSEYEPGRYGRETDWWSMGSMLYEMIYGIAPFFAPDIRQTYMKIMDHNRSLRFKSKFPVSTELQDLLRRCLTDAEFRIGRGSVKEIMKHPFFKGINWERLHERSKHENLHLPQFTYSVPVPQPTTQTQSQSLSAEESHSKGFGFSAFFESSSVSSGPAQNLSVSQQTPSRAQPNRSILRDHISGSFIGFSWGPAIDTFDNVESAAQRQSPGVLGLSPMYPGGTEMSTPRSSRTTFPRYAKTPGSVGMLEELGLKTPASGKYPFATPVRPKDFSTPFRPSTIRQSAKAGLTGTQRRTVSDREAMKQLVDCVGMSARKKVLESGRKPRVLKSASTEKARMSSGGTGTGSRRSSGMGTLKELRFDRSVMVLNPDSAISFRMDPMSTLTSISTLSAFASTSTGHSTSSVARTATPSLSLSIPGSISVGAGDLTFTDGEDGSVEVPWSPSPSPRPGSAMSMMSRRSGSQTPTVTGSGLVGLSLPRNPSSSRLHDLVAPQNPPNYSKTSTQTPGPRQQRRHTVSGSGFADEVLDDLDVRHSRLMAEIDGLSRRLDMLSKEVSDSENNSGHRERRR